MTKKEAYTIYIVAQKMSNWLYNMAYHDKLKPESAVMREMVKDWDDTKQTLYDFTKTKKRKARK